MRMFGFRFHIDFLLMRYDLTSPQGIALMTLAESILRIPDKTTQNALIRDKLAFMLPKSILSGGMLVIRPVVQQVMRILGKHFVQGITIEEALRRAAPK